MAIKVISDVHGAYVPLREQLDADDTAFLLGDYLNLIDFQTLDGILAQVYSREEVVRALAIMASRDKDLARQKIREVIGDSPEKSQQVRALVLESYMEFFKSIPCRCFMLYGNTDSPDALRALVSGDVEIVEAAVVTIDGLRFGMVSGAPRGPWNVGLPGEMSTERYEDLIGSLGPCDVLCTHYPPAVQDLTFDTHASRDEAGSEALLAYIDEHSPSYHYFGHVHHPRSTRERRGTTELVNVGYFKETRKAVIHPA